MTGEMLKSYLSPAAPARVLEYFFLNPLGRLLQSNLGSDLDLAPLRLLLPRLVQAGLLVREEEGRGRKKVFYRANLDSPLFAELRVLFLDDRRKISRGALPRRREGEGSSSDQGLPPEGSIPSEVREPAENTNHSLSEGKAAGNPSPLDDFLPLLGTSAALRETRRQIERLLPLDVDIFLRGESGTGKEGVARAIGESVAGSGVRFFSVTCPSFSSASLDLLLFGQEKGPVSERRPGLLGSPGGGGVFLREVQTLPPPLQRKLFRAMEERQYVPVDGISSFPVNVRLIFGSSSSLTQELEEGTLLRELHSKLGLYQVRIPPLRERPEDIPVLAGRLLTELCRKKQRKAAHLEPEAERYLMGHPWPGNLRELSGVLERTLNFTEGCSIGRAGLSSFTEVRPPHDVESLKEARQDFSRQHVSMILARYGGDKVAAARALQVDLSTLYRFLQPPAMLWRSAESPRQSKLQG